MPLEQVFSLTPRAAYVNSESCVASLHTCGSVVYPSIEGTRNTYGSLFGADEIFFRQHMCGTAPPSPSSSAPSTPSPGSVPAYSTSTPVAPLDIYTSFSNRVRVPHVGLDYRLKEDNPHKDMSLIFRFDAVLYSRLLIYTNAELVGEEILEPGDDQFGIVVEGTQPLFLHFLHVTREAQEWGGDWYFKGIDGYLV